MLGRVTVENELLIEDRDGEFPIVEQTRRYVIAKVPASMASAGKVIMCRTCKRVSASPGDVKEKYCGYCHECHGCRGACVTRTCANCGVDITKNEKRGSKGVME